MTHVITFIYALGLGVLFGNNIGRLSVSEVMQIILWPLWLIWLLLLGLNRTIQKYVPIYDAISVWFRYILLHRYFKIDNVKFLKDVVLHLEENPTWGNRLKIRQLKTIIQLNTKNDTNTKEHSRD